MLVVWKWRLPVAGMTMGLYSLHWGKYKMALWLDNDSILSILQMSLYSLQVTFQQVPEPNIKQTTITWNNSVMVISNNLLLHNNLQKI